MAAPTPAPPFVMQPEDDAGDGGSEGGALAPVGSLSANNVAAAEEAPPAPPRVAWLRQVAALVVVYAALVRRRIGICTMLLGAPTLMVLGSFGVSSIDSLANAIATAPTPNEGGLSLGAGFELCSGPANEAHEGDVAATGSTGVLWLLSFGFVFQTMAVAIVLAAETRSKGIRAVVNLSTPLSAVYAAWFVALSAYACAGAVLATVVGYAVQLHVFAFTNVGVMAAIMITAAVAHVAMGILVGSLVTRVLLVHALNLALLLLAVTVTLLPLFVGPADAFSPYTSDETALVADLGAGIAPGRSRYVHAAGGLGSVCLTWPSGLQSMWAPVVPQGDAHCTSANGADSQGRNCSGHFDAMHGAGCEESSEFDTANFSALTACCLCGGGTLKDAGDASSATLPYAFAWNPTYNLFAALTDILALQELGGNTTQRECRTPAGLGNTTHNTTEGTKHEHCTYTTRNFVQSRDFPYFPAGHQCTDYPQDEYPYPTPLLPSSITGCSASYYTSYSRTMRLATYQAPGAGSNTLANLLLVLVYLVLAVLYATLFPHDTGVLRPQCFSRRVPAGPDGTGAAAAARRARAWRRGARRVVIQGATKTFGTKTAVDNVTATMREGEVFALLGHNGAGKSTLFQMLAGNIPMTSGSASVYGLDVAADTEAVRRLSGICTQDDVLWPELTGFEHVRAYLRLRGEASDATAVDTVLDELGLRELGAQPVASLSGGMKRRLSVALASIGTRTKVLFFDEPTTGLDPINARLVWALLQRAKKTRIVVITTHSMEEAELLADRVGVMNNGVLRACGTPIYLKTALGGGATDKFRIRVTLAADAPATEFTEQILGVAPGTRVVSTSSSTAPVVSSQPPRASGPASAPTPGPGSGSDGYGGASHHGADGTVVVGVGLQGLEKVEVLFEWLNHSPLILRWRVFNMTLEDVFRLVGGRDQDPGSRSSPRCGASCCYCCYCMAGSSAPDDGDLDAASLDLESAAKAVVELMEAPAKPAAATAQIAAVIAKNMLLLGRGNWKGLLVLFLVCTAPVLITAAFLHGNSNGPADSVLMLVAFGLAPSFMLPWLVVVTVQDNAEGLFELMVLQGLRLRSHVVGTFGYIFIVSLAAGIAVYVVCAVTVSPFVIGQSAGAVMFTLLALIVNAVWTGSVAMLLTSVFRSSGMAAGVTGLCTLLLVTTAMMIVLTVPQQEMDVDDTFQNDFDNDFFNEPYPKQLSLAPYFGYFVTLSLVGNPINSDGSDPHAVPDIYGKSSAALGLTLVQAAVFFALGMFVYSRRIANRGLVPTPRRSTDVEAAPLLGAVPARAGDAEIGAFLGTRKVYKSRGQKTKVALKGLRLGIQPGEFIGVLGPNGAGKSTAFNIMAGLQTATSGDVTIKGISVTENCAQTRAYLGCCPQFPRLWSDLTVADHLGLYAALRGLPSPFSFSAAERARAHHTVKVLANVMQLGGANLHKPARTLSGGMKRRLSLAISLVGYPPLTVLDEPTTGLDPITRRDVWGLLAQLQRKDGNACVISTHSMEEADTLCNRIAIITSGQLRVSGTQEELKARFGTGFTVQLTLANPSHDTNLSGFDVEVFLRDNVHRGAGVKTQTGRVCSCHIPADADLARLFRALCEADQGGHLQDWLVSETTLEDVFVRVVAAHEHENPNLDALNTISTHTHTLHTTQAQDQV